MRKLNKLTATDTRVASVGDLEWPEVQAILKTMADDETLQLHKLEVRRKQDGIYRVIVRAAKKEKA